MEFGLNSEMKARFDYSKNDDASVQLGMPSISLAFRACHA